MSACYYGYYQTFVSLIKIFFRLIDKIPIQLSNILELQKDGNITKEEKHMKSSWKTATYCSFLKYPKRPFSIQKNFTKPKNFLKRSINLSENPAEIDLSLKIKRYLPPICLDFAVFMSPLLWKGCLLLYSLRSVLFWLLLL